MYYILTCNGYTVEAEAMTLRAAIGLAADLERRHDDGYARVVSHDGSIVADAEGSYPEEEQYVDAATQTGMYDAW